MTIFLGYLDEVLCPKLHLGQEVETDNPLAHTIKGVRQRIEACGASLLYLPPYSPNLNPIAKLGPSSKQVSDPPKPEPSMPSKARSPTCPSVWERGKRLVQTPPRKLHLSGNDLETFAATLYFRWSCLRPQVSGSSHVLREQGTYQGNTDCLTKLNRRLFDISHSRTSM